MLVIIVKSLGAGAFSRDLPGIVPQIWPCSAGLLAGFEN